MQPNKRRNNHQEVVFPEILTYPAKKFLFQVNIGNMTAKYKTCSDFTIKATK